jgi:hypothetical protein
MRRKRGSLKNRRDGQLAVFEDEEKYIQFNYPSPGLNDVSTPLLGSQVSFY